ncbi:MAG TPA: GGDEF domain-containing protein [Phycisphaerae bacterium]|nr:GGDEF domain-containing protein [Phycisphaerae bacterium]
MSVPILDKIRQADNLPSLPTVAIQVLRMTQSENLSVADIAKVIQQDPALTGKLLRVVNSSLFGMSRKISSLQQAMVVLGLRTVRVIVLSFSLVDTLGKPESHFFDYRLFWRRSLTTAVAAKLMGEKTQRNGADENFVAGLLCDIGLLAAVHCARDLYHPVLAAYRDNRQTLQVAERQFLGLTHEDISAELLDHWGLPTELCEAVRTHHHPLAEPAPEGKTISQLSRALRAAALLADVFVEDTQAGSLESIKQEIVSGLRTAEPETDDLLKDLDAQVREMASLFAINIGQTMSYQEIQGNAVTQLARLTMAAEIDRAQTAQREQEARQQVQELNDQNRELTEKAATDALTEIANRMALEERLAEDCENARRNHTPIGVIMMDLDRFKKLNDTFGHQTGDEALRMVGGVLKQVVTETQFAGRYGGEEFALIVINVTARELRAMAEEIRLSIAKLRVPYEGRFIHFTASLGAAHMNPDDPELEPRILFRRADEYLYEAKNNGRNRVVCVDSRQAALRHQRSPSLV